MKPTMEQILTRFFSRIEPQLSRDPARREEKGHAALGSSSPQRGRQLHPSRNRREPQKVASWQESCYFSNATAQSHEIRPFLLYLVCPCLGGLPRRLRGRIHARETRRIRPPGPSHTPR